MKIPKSEKDFEELLKGIKWNRIIPPMVSVMQPIIIFGAWLGFSMIDKKASAVSKLIAICEPIPTIDLNVPKPVVLASLYHSTDEALKILKDVIEFLKEFDIPSADEIINDIKEEITGKGVEDKTQFLKDYKACERNAKNKLGVLYNRFTGMTWILSCMIQKGYTRALIEEEIKILIGV